MKNMLQTNWIPSHLLHEALHSAKAHETKNGYTWERKYSNIDCSLQTAANQTFVYKPILNLIYDCSEPCRIEGDPRQWSCTEYFGKKFGGKCLPLPGFPRVSDTLNKLNGFSSLLSAQPACYYVQAVLNTASWVAVIAARQANMISCTVSLTIWRCIGGKEVEPNLLTKNSAQFFPSTDFHMVRPTVNKWILCLVTMDF